MKRVVAPAGLALAAVAVTGLISVTGGTEPAQDQDPAGGARTAAADPPDSPPGPSEAAGPEAARWTAAGPEPSRRSSRTSTP
jgi:hypothetical protein